MATSAKRTDGELPKGLDVDQFLAWVKDRPGRYELFDGQVIAMAPERVGHARVKGAVYRALVEAIARSAAPCEALPDGVSIRISARRWYEPDAVVTCGPAAPDDDIDVKNPVIVVEVTSPSTAHLDETKKLTGYFSVPSVMHYLVVDPDPIGAPIVHHQRQGDGTILTRLITDGTIRLDPPGIEVAAAELLR